MTIFLSLLALSVIGFIAYLTSLPGKYEVRVSKPIDAELEAVFDKVLHLNSWSEWSPWLMHEPDCPLSFEGNTTEVGGSYSWDGKHIGAGTLTHKQIDRPKYAEQELSFTRPFKSQCKVTFEFKQSEEGVVVTWSMFASMPFLFRPMIGRIKEMLIQDYEIGLARLAGVMAPQSEHPEYSFIGNQKREPTKYIALPWEGSLEDMPEAMKKGFSELYQYVESGNVCVAGQPFTVIHKAKKRATYFVLDMGIPVEESTTDSRYEIKQLKGGSYYQTQLKGSYNFLKSAWYLAMGHLKMTKIKMDWTRPCVELYENDPNKVENSNELVTSIFIPTK